MSSGRLLRGLPAAGSLATRIAMTGVAGFLAACLFEDPVAEGPSTETGNPALAGILRDTLGRPAAGANVLLYRHGPDTFPAVSPVRLDSFRTDADGAYRFDSLAPATIYAVEASDAARRTFSFLPAAEVPAGAKRFLRRDTLVLKRPGSLSGIARRDSNPRPPGVAGESGILVRVIGLDRAAYTDSAGRYALADIPEGTYRIHFMAADGHYLGEVAGPVAVDAGAAVELPPIVLDWSPFVAPPSPGGLSVTPDSAAGIIHLSWNRVFVSNFDHYRILRSDSAASPAAPDTFRTRDTAYADTVKHLPAGRILQYRVLAVNTLGNVSENPGPRLVPVPVPKDTTPAALDITALVLSEAEGGAPARALVRLYAIPSAPGPVDSLPRRVALVDSARSGADGRVVFAGRAAGRYTLSALSEPGGSGAPVAALVGVSPRPRAGGATDTLRLAASGSLEGTATRQQLWCSSSAKQNENIEISLAGTPWFAVTDFDGKYVLEGLPAGSYRAVAIALPQGCFLPDTVAAVIAPGQATILAALPARPNPGFIPKVAGLRVASSAGAAVALEWNPVSSAYPDLQGYEVFRRDASQAVTAASGLLAGTAWTDDLGALAPGTRVSWVVRAVGKGGAPGPYGGDAAGNPVYYLVP